MSGDSLRHRLKSFFEAPTSDRAVKAATVLVKEYAGSSYRHHVLFELIGHFYDAEQRGDLAACYADREPYLLRCFPAVASAFAEEADLPELLPLLTWNGFLAENRGTRTMLLKTITALARGVSDAKLREKIMDVLMRYLARIAEIPYKDDRGGYSFEKSHIQLCAKELRDYWQGDTGNGRRRTDG